MQIFRDWTFKWWEVSMLKLGLMSLGILLGTYFTDYLSGLEILWWVLFVGTSLYFIVWMSKKV